MKTGKLFDHITIYSLTSSENSGDVTEITDEGLKVRAKVTQVDGSRYLSMEELVDREVYEIELWDYSWSSNISMMYGTKLLYPIRPVLRNADQSKRNVVKIIAATKV
jgi:hypothetical protein